jgi:predicted Zn-dependent protease with MMP-like domain
VPVTIEEFESVVDRVLDELPEWVVDRIDNLMVVVENVPTREQDPDGDGLLGCTKG